MKVQNLRVWEITVCKSVHLFKILAFTVHKYQCAMHEYNISFYAPKNIWNVVYSIMLDIFELLHHFPTKPLKPSIKVIIEISRLGTPIINTLKKSEIGRILNLVQLKLFTFNYSNFDNSYLEKQQIRKLKDIGTQYLCGHIHTYYLYIY